MTTPARARAPSGPVAPGFAELHGGDATVLLVPALGGKIRDITLAGRQWLWHNPDVPFTMPAEGASFAEAGNSGGFDDCLPTSSECLIPTWVQGVRSRQLPDHGELWSHQPQVLVTADERGPAATCTWTGTAMPYCFARTVAVRRDGSVEFTYALTNAGSNRMPFLWASHPMLPLTEHTRIVLPEGARTRVGAQHGITIGRAGAEHRWPRLRVGSSLLDVSRPATSQKDDFACKLFVDLPKGDVVIAVEEERVRLEIQVNGNSLGNVGLRIDRRGWSPAATKRWNVPLLPLRAARPHANVVFGPCLGAPDGLSEALGAWDDAHWVEAGATTRWSMVWRGVHMASRERA